MRFVNLALCVAFVSSVASFSSTASAQSTGGFALNRFDPSERGSEWFVLDSLDMRGHLRPAVGVIGDWGYKPLVLYKPNGDEQAALVEHQIFAHLGGSLVLWDRVRGGLDIPIAAYQTGDSFAGFKPPESAFGDIRVSADVRLLGEYGSIFNSAVGFSLYLPTGSRDNFTGDGNVRFAPHAMVSGDLAIDKDLGFAYAGKLGATVRTLTDQIDPKNSIGSELTIGASAGIRTLEKKLLVGPELYGATTYDGFLDKRTTPLEWLIGAHYTYTDFRFGLGLGSGLTRGWGTPVFRMVGGVEWAPGADKDTDGDGILDSEDACPNVPGLRTNDPKTNGCPPPPPMVNDRDKDGIADNVDACPDVPGVPSTDPKKNGCPADRDNDNIPDTVDACPDIPGVASDDPKKNGCPPDRDGDGIYDAEDACPDVAGVKSDDPKRNGCPPDRDGDGIIDPQDACPDAPGPQDPDPKKNGCPLARIEDGQVKIIQQVKFKTNSAEILRESDPTLIAVATILKDHPEIKSVRIEGHTDNRGNAKYNKELSDKRAASVAKWLTTFGIDKKRLASKGFGMEKPIDTNETDEGRQNNRRVEFHIDNGTAAPDTKKPADAKPAPAPKK